MPPGDLPVGARFSDVLAARVAERESQVVLGLDPDAGRVWPEALDADPRTGAPAERAAEVVVAHCAALIAAAGPACVAVKPQVACFERLGAPGWAALDRVAAAARAVGLLVLADGKRGDIGVTAEAYTQALLTGSATPVGPVPGVGADARTVNPYLGDDALGPFVASGRGLFVLVRTSNPGAADVQDLDASGVPVWEHLARIADELGSGSVGECGLSSVGAVTGATRPDLLVRLRDVMPRAIFLLPGVGAQGGKVEDLAPAFAPHPAAGLVTASRSIVNAHEERGGDPAEAARAAAEELRETAAAL